MRQERLSQERAPLWEALAAHAAGRRARFHVPAHGGRFPALRSLLGVGARVDLTELDDLGDLHAPSGPIAAAERLAAEGLGADDAHFLVNGTTAGIEALLLAAAGPGAKVLIGRDVHRSVIAGLILAGAEPVYMRPRIDGSAGRSLGVPAEEVLAALAANPDVAACQLTNPNYYGIERDYATVYGAVRARTAPTRPAVLVDEAHGAYRYFEAGRRGDLAAGADGAALSFHKSGLSPTQSALVALRGPAIDRIRLRAGLRLVQSSSPSYLLMAGLDLARRELALRGPELIARSRARRRELAERVGNIEGLSVWTPTGSDVESAHPLRLLVDVTALGITGWHAAAFLAEQGIDCELADFGGILLALDFFGGATQDRRLLAGLRALARAERGRRRKRTALAGEWRGLYSSARIRALTPREAFFAASEFVLLRAAAGRVAADVVCPYPPGVPLLVPGELITREDCALIETILRAGGRVQGVNEAGRLIAVVKDPVTKGRSDQ